MLRGKRGHGRAARSRAFVLIAYCNIQFFSLIPIGDSASILSLARALARLRQETVLWMDACFGRLLIRQASMRQTTLNTLGRGPFAKRGPECSERLVKCNGSLGEFQLKRELHKNLSAKHFAKALLARPAGIEIEVVRHFQ